MADPKKYQRGYSFSGYQANSPSKPLPGQNVDNELENIEQSIGGLVDGLKNIRRGDGKLQNGGVTRDSLGVDFAATAIEVVSGAIADAVVQAATLYPTLTAARAADLSVVVAYFRTAGYAAAGDGGGALYRLIPGPLTPQEWQYEGANGIWFKLAETTANVRMFGARGDAATDDTAAIRAAVGYAAAKSANDGLYWFGAQVYFPAGRYKTTGVISSTVPVAIVGQGRSVSIIEHAGANGLFAFTSSRVTDGFLFRDLGLRATVPNAGAAITLNAAASASSNFPNAELRDLHIWSDLTSAFWNKGIVVSNIWHYEIVSVFVKGSGAVANWIDPAIDVGAKCIDGRIENTYIYGAKTAVMVSAPNVEGVRISQCSFVAVRLGVVFPHPASVPPHFDISHTHIAASHGCVNLAGGASAMLKGNLFYLGAQGPDPTPDGSVAVMLMNHNGFIIAGKMISGLPGNVASVGIQVNNSGLWQISDNYIAQFTSGILPASDCSNAHIGLNRFFNVTNEVVGGFSNTVHVHSAEQVFHAESFVKTLAGGAPTEVVDFAIPPSTFGARPSVVVVTEAGTTGIVVFYQYEAAESTSSNVRVLLRAPSGNITAGLRRFSVVAYA
jgi:hypothetical protein